MTPSFSMDNVKEDLRLPYQYDHVEGIFLIVVMVVEFICRTFAT